MATECAQTCYKEANKEVMGSRNSGILRIENNDGNGESFVNYIQLFSDKVETTFRSTALVAHPVHAFFRNMSA